MSRLDAYLAEKLQIKPEQLSRQAIEAWQLKAMNDLLTWCKQHSSYYDSYPDRLQTLEDMTALPFLTGQTLAEQGHQLLCVSQSAVNRVVTMQTSGTSGLSKRLYFSAADQQLTVDFFACGLSELHEPGDCCMILMPGNHPGGMSHLIQQALRKLEVEPVACAPDGTFAQMAALLEQYKVNTIVGSPAQILSLGRYLQHYHLPHAIKAVLVSSDYLPETVRKALEATLHCAVYDHYGITEAGLGFSIECEMHQGLHIRENDLLVEIIDCQTNLPVADGQWGELVFTTLTRRAMPLIRYRTGDKARLLAAPCPCGSVVKRMDKIPGRIVQLQEPYSMPLLDELLFQLPQVVDYQARYHTSQQCLTLQLLLTSPLQTVEPILQKLLQPVLHKTHQLQLEAVRLDAAQKPLAKSLYTGKRKILEAGTE